MNASISTRLSNRSANSASVTMLIATAPAVAPQAAGGQGLYGGR
jgi:hypothetical protein